MINKKYLKYVFLVITIANAIVQLSEKPLKTSNWLSAICFLIVSISYFRNENKK